MSEPASVIPQAKLTSPDGRVIVVTPEVFDAFYDFMIRYKRFGSVTVHFKMGVLAGIESVTKKIYK